MNNAQPQNEEISLLEIIQILWEKRMIIGIGALIVTLAGSFYSFFKIPVYEAKALFEIGTYTSDNGSSIVIDDASVVAKRLHLLFIEIDGMRANRTALVTKIAATNGLQPFLEIKSEAASNEQAKTKILDILRFIQIEHRKKLDAVLDRRRTEYNNINSQLTNTRFKTDQQTILFYKYQERKNQLEGLMLPQNYKNTELIGDVLLYNTPIKPNKTLIIVISFALGLMTSTILALFLNFLEGEKQSSKFALSPQTTTPKTD